MRLKSLFIVISSLVLNVSCVTTETETQLIKSNDFWDFKDFIHQNPQSKHFEKALKRYLHLKDSVGYYEMCMKNNLDIEPINADTILIFGYCYPIDSVRSLCLDYLKTEGHWEFYRFWKKEVRNPFNNATIALTRGRFDINIYFDKSPYSTTQSVVIETIKAIEIYKDELSIEHFKNSYDKLKINELHFIDSLFGNRIDFFNFKFQIPPPPKEPGTLLDYEILEES